MSRQRHEASFEGYAHDGKFAFDDATAAAYRKWFGQAFGDGEPVEVIFRRPRKSRSPAANRYWWGVVIKTLATELGYADPEELHNALVFKFRPSEPDPLTGSPRRESTHDKDTTWFSDLISDVKMWAEADLNIVIPDSEG